MIRTAFLWLSALLVLAPRPDEGQWLPQQFLDRDWEELKARGLTLTKDEFWHPERGGVLSAAVQLGGCSASFVSPDGLVATNHHCGFAAIEQNSTPQANRLRDGFVAATRAEELRTREVLYVVRRIEDVTAKVVAAREGRSDPYERMLATEATLRALVVEGEKQPDTRCSVATFFEGRQYLLYHRTQIRDVRLVYAPPRAIGEFGGEIDNWEWPRHTGDFTLFRAYVGKDGKPAAYAKDNVPFRPQHYLRVAKDGVKEGDLVMVLGYPGRTERYLSSFAVAERQGVTWPRREELMTRLIARLEESGEGDPALTLRLTTRIKALANVQKAARGQVWGLARNGVVAAKLREEERFRAWVAADPQRAERYGSVLDELIALDREAARTQERDLLLGEMLRGLPFLRAWLDLYDALDKVPEDSAKVPAPLAAPLAAPALAADLQRVEKRLAGVLFEEARRLPGPQSLAAVAALGEGNGDQLAERVYGASKLASSEFRRELLAADKAALLANEDPFLRFARALAAERRAITKEAQTLAGRRLAVGPRWIEAQEAFRGKAFYPDANGTLRVSVATVRGFVPRDGVLYTPRTTVAGLLEKETGQEPFANPPALLAAAKERARSRFADATLGDVPVCFLSDADTTGGNSGSCVINGRGELVGLNFDRVFQNVVGDYGWSGERSRNVVVDVRYLGWVMESVLPAPHVLQEMGL